MTNQSELRKAAVLISSLEQSAAQALLAKFPPAQAEKVREAARRLHDISPEERRRVMREFMGATAAEESDESGVELDFSLADKLEHGYEDPPSWTPPPEPETPFRFLHEAKVEQLVRLLSGERPQMIALVMAHLPADKAAATLGRFDNAQQADVLARLAELDDASPQVLAEIEEELRGLLAEKHRVSEKRKAGFAAVAAILGAAGKNDRQSLLTSLAGRDAKLVSRLGYPATEEPLAELAGHATVAPEFRGNGNNLRPGTGQTSGAPRAENPSSIAREPAKQISVSEPATSPLEFADLIALDDASLATLVARSDKQVLRLALSGAEDSFISRMTSGLSRGEAKNLRRQLVAIGPIRLSDMEAAQEQLAALADRLCRAGTIAHPFESTSLTAG